MHKSGIRSLALLMLLGTAFLAVPASASDETTATTLLFSTPYLAQLKSDETLVYDFVRTTSDEERYGQKLNDTVRLDIRTSEDDNTKRTTYIHLYSGPKERNIGPFVNSSGNAAVMIVLEQDTYELKRRLGGQPAYFRNKIRAAMRDNAKVEKTSFEFEGKTIQGHKITIEPFKGDPNMTRVPEYANSVYEFVVADAVPGGLYRVSSIIPNAKDSSQPLKQQDMIYSGRKAAE
jgi:hypothetical protein